MTIQQLASRSVTLDGSGNGTVRVGPTFYGQMWKVSNTAVNTSTATKHPVCRTFLNAAVAGAQLDATYTGDNDSSDTAYELSTGQTVVAQWTGGDVGATATLTLYGEQVVG